jgi:ankyrin repeat protein
MEEQWKSYPWSPNYVSKFEITDTSPLHVAARFGIGKLAQTLLQEPISDLNLTGSLNRTPLMLAAAYGHISVLRMLLECEEIDINLMDCNHRTAERFPWPCTVQVCTIYSFMGLLGSNYNQAIYLNHANGAYSMFYGVFQEEK